MGVPLRIFLDVQTAKIGANRFAFPWFFILVGLLLSMIFFGGSSFEFVCELRKIGHCFEVSDFRVSNSIAGFAVWMECASVDLF